MSSSAVVWQDDHVGAECEGFKMLSKDPWDAC